MMLTEEEAKGKWCPFVRLAKFDNRANPFTETGPLLTCLASSCMAWRWEVVAETTSSFGQGTNYREVALRRTGRGYCGLAGQPMAEPPT